MNLYQDRYVHHVTWPETEGRAARPTVRPVGGLQDGLAALRERLRGESLRPALVRRTR